MRDEGGLHRMKLVALGQALDGDDLRAVEAQRESQTRIDPPPVHEHGASAALPAVAALLGSGQVEALAQEIEKRCARVIERERPVTPLTVSVVEKAMQCSIRAMDQERPPGGGRL